MKREWKGLRFGQGADESPLFPPQCQDNQEAKESILQVVRRDPRDLGIEQTRWTLEAILSVCDWTEPISAAGLSKLLDRVSIFLKLGRQHLHSPDPDYDAKLAYVKDLYQQVRLSDGLLVLLYLDELTYYRQPSVSRAYEECGKTQPLAELGYRSNTATRVGGLLDAFTGSVIYHQGKVLGVNELVDLYREATQRYPDAERIYVAQDNWPVHFHVDVLVALEPQEIRWPIHRPSNWSTEPSKKAIQQHGSLRLPIQLVQLPTYSPWTNPIEKLWRKLKQELLHMHRFADRLTELRTEVCHFFDKFIAGSLDLLRYVGLPIPN